MPKIKTIIRPSGFLGKDNKDHIGPSGKLLHFKCTKKIIDHESQNPFLLDNWAEISLHLLLQKYNSMSCLRHCLKGIFQRSHPGFDPPTIVGLLC